MEEFYIDGLKEVEKSLQELTPKLQASVLRAVNRKAVKKFITDNLKQTLNYSAKSMKGIQIVNDKGDPTGVYGGITSDAFWLRFSDRGTGVRTTSKGANRGSITGRQQIQPTILNSVDDIIKYMNEELFLITEEVLRKRIKSTKGKLLKMSK